MVPLLSCFSICWSRRSSHTAGFEAENAALATPGGRTAAEAAWPYRVHERRSPVLHSAVSVISIGCPFRKFHPAWIRVVRQIIASFSSDVCGPAHHCPRYRQPVQVAQAVGSRESVAPSPAERGVAAGTSTPPSARCRPMPRKLSWCRARTRTSACNDTCRHSGLMPACFTTALQRANSLRMNAPKSSGAAALHVRSLIGQALADVGHVQILASSALSRCTIGAGVPPGATTPYQSAMSMPG